MSARAPGGVDVEVGLVEQDQRVPVLERGPGYAGVEA
jgi:hypothetical protein